MLTGGPTSWPDSSRRPDVYKIAPLKMESDTESSSGEEEELESGPAGAEFGAEYAGLVAGGSTPAPAPATSAVTASSSSAGPPEKAGKVASSALRTLHVAAKDVGAAALLREQHLQEKTLMYMSNSDVIALIFEPTHENHLVDAAYTTFRQFILRNEWHIKRVKATDDEKQVYKTAGAAPKYWLYVGRTANALKERMALGHEIRRVHGSDDPGLSAAAGAAAGAGGNTRSSTQREAASKPTPYIFFCDLNRDEVKKANPEATLGDIGKILGSMWNSLSSTDRSSWSERAAADN